MTPFAADINYPYLMIGYEKSKYGILNLNNIGNLNQQLVDNPLDSPIS